jgi:colanic acid/amylovoran biosynthesis protein
MLIAERMHATIAGISSGVCSVAIGYSVKAEGILSDVFGSELTRERYLIPIGEFVKEQGAICKIQAAWQRREETREILERALPDVTARARLNFDLLAELLK